MSEIKLNNLQTQPSIFTGFTAPAPQNVQKPKLANTLAQAGRIVGGIAQGTLKAAAAPALLRDAIRKKPASNAPNGRQVPSILQPSVSTTDATTAINAGIENWTNSWVPAPASPIAQFAAKAADVIGEAIPVTAATIAGGATGLGSVLVGNTLGYATGAAQAVGSELLEGSGDPVKALARGATAWASEAIGGKTLDVAAGKIGVPILRGAASALGEGLEENIDGILYSALTGEEYTAQEAKEDLLYGAIAGLALNGVRNVVNAVNEGVTTIRVGRAVNESIKNAASADITNVRSLIDNASTPAEAVIAEDSLTALQKSVANPVNEISRTSNIPAEIAERFGLTPAEGGDALTVRVRSYESHVDPVVSAMTAPTVTVEERAGINPNEVSPDNPRALYKYAEDIYLRPQTDLNQLFTYRGQANQFYGSSVENGIPSSGVGTSWEGAGVYSSPTPFTTDLYGPSGRLADNPYANRGIPQKAIDSDYPVGVVLSQAAGMTEDVGKLTRTDAPQEVVESGTRRIRYDSNGQLVTEVINNPADVAVAGLNFGRTTVEESTPIQYATASTDSSAIPVKPSTVTTQADTTATNAEAVGNYQVTNLIETEAISAVNMRETTAENAPSSSLNESPLSYVSELSELSETAAETARSEARNRTIEQHVENMMEGLNATYSSASTSYNRNYGGLSGNKFEAEQTNRRTESVSNSEALARSIWTPEVQQRQAIQNPEVSKPDRRKEENPQEANFYRGNGSAGKIFESDSYKTAFGNLMKR